MKLLLNILCLLGLMLTSCTTIESLSFDIIQPAKITFPVYARSITTVSRKMSEKEFSGTYINGYEKLQKLSIKTRKNLGATIERSIINTLNETQYFSRIESYGEIDAEVLNDKIIQGIKDSTSTSSILFLKSFSIKPTLIDFIYGSSSEYYTSTFRIKIKAVFDIYLGNDIQPKTIAFTDSIKWDSYSTNKEDLHQFIPDIDECLKEAAEYIGNKVVQQLLPSNKNVKRFYFNTSSPIMKDADRYWKSGNYDYASYLWEYMYETSKKNYFKAMAAANLALYNELKDNYTQAEIWAKISIDLFKDNSEEQKMMENYLKELKKRIEDDQILRFQLI